jgi:putrescine aminotransferase
MQDETKPSSVFGWLQRHTSRRIAVLTRAVGTGAVERSASGARIHLSDGRSVLDFGSYAVTLLGHRHAEVVEAVRRQLDSQPTSTRTLANPATARAAAALGTYLPELPRILFGLNGSDVVEAAAKLARLATGRPRILAVEGAYHGKSLGALALTHHPDYRRGLAGTTHSVTHIAADDAEAVAREAAAGDVAALIFEPIQGESGIRPLDPAVLSRWCATANERGVMVVVDEIQTGLRRCGEPSLAWAAGLHVDALLFGKPLGGGVVPISALLCRDALFQPLTDEPYLHTATFAGHPLSCAAVPVALDLIERLADRGAELAAMMKAGLDTLADDFPETVLAVRGSGLLWGLQLAGPESAERAVLTLARHGLLVSPCLGARDTIRLLPPMVCTDEELAEAFAVLRTTLARTVSEVRA